MTDFNSDIVSSFKGSFTTCSLPKINYCNGYIGITGMKGLLKIGSNFSIEIKEVKESNAAN